MAGRRRTSLSTPSAVALRASLQRWYRSHRRDLPWRRTNDPYAIWVSEVMLQQTTVATVIGYYERFLAAFPDVAALGAADEGDVLRLWSGLGYYRRARNLQRAARELVARGDRALPRSASALAELPGIGAYTAAAIASIAYGEAVPVVDGNVERVVARLFAIDGDPRRAPARASIAERAAELLDASAPGDWNQAMMELGATVCAPRAPRCLVCPLATACSAHASGTEERFPVPAARPATVAVVRVAFLLRDPSGRALFARIPPETHNAGLWEFPAATVHGSSSDGEPPSRWSAALGERAAAMIARRLHARVIPGGLCGRVRHAITHHRITTYLVDAALDGRAPKGPSWQRLALGRAASEALSGEARKLLRLIEGART